MARDLEIPQTYGIHATVGDTAGPGGWSRSIRNLPLFQQFARDFAELCPTAFIANYTNPMSTLTAALQLCGPNPSVGLCHAYFETKDVIQKIFDLEDWSQISVDIAGLNHFTWVTDMRIGREDGYKLLREKVGDGSLADVLPTESSDDIGHYTTHKLCVEFYDAFGYLPYPADRHTSEFVSFVLCGDPPRHEVTVRGKKMEATDYCGVRRTTIEHRRQTCREQRAVFDKMIAGEHEMPERSRETGAEMIRAYLRNEPFCDAVNCLNTGQIPGLPLGACVETLGVIDGLGTRPLMVDKVPEHLLEIMRPQAVCTKWTVEGMIAEDKDKLLQALYRDPSCSHLKPHEIRDMARELIEANRPWLPQWLTA
jgi:alpha-galactosidase